MSEISGAHRMPLCLPVGGVKSRDSRSRQWAQQPDMMSGSAWDVDSDDGEGAMDHRGFVPGLEEPPPAEVKSPVLAAAPKKRGRPCGSRKVEVIMKRRAIAEIDEALVAGNNVPQANAGGTVGGSSSSSSVVTHLAPHSSEAKGHPAPESELHSALRRFFEVSSPLETERLLLNMKAAAAMANIDRRRVPEYLAALSDTLCLDMSSALQSLLQAISCMADVDRARPVTFVHRRKYDETPLRLRVRWAEHENPELEGGAKLMVMESAWMLVVELFGEGRKSLGCFAVRGMLPVRMVPMSSMTADAVRHVVNKFCALPPEVHRLFPCVDTVVCTDEHASNMAAEFQAQDEMFANALGVVGRRVVPAHQPRLAHAFGVRLKRRHFARLPMCVKEQSNKASNLRCKWG